MINTPGASRSPRCACGRSTARWRAATSRRRRQRALQACTCPPQSVIVCCSTKCSLVVLKGSWAPPPCERYALPCSLKRGTCASPSCGAECVPADALALHLPLHEPHAPQRRLVGLREQKKHKQSGGNHTPFPPALTNSLLLTALSAAIERLGIDLWRQECETTHSHRPTHSMQCRSG